MAGTPLLKLTYGQTATIYRINLGWLRRENKAQLGFVLDVDRGYWAKNSMTEDAEAGTSGHRQEIVIPYVEDRRNSLLVELLPAPEMGERVDWRERRKLVASMMAALKLAIQIEYQLEDNELAAEMLPNAEQPRLILLYEAAEGGAGVLHRLLGEPGAVARVAARALDVCHFDPLTGADQHRAVNAREDCEAACYNCLLNYQNQIHHELLDRFASHNLLLRLTQATTHEQAAATTSAVVASLTDTRSTNALDIDANLAARWLDYVQRHGLRLPDQVQPTLPRCASATPDFAYAKVAIYIDGDEQRASRDLDKLRAYRDQGWRVIRFGSDEESWAAAFGSNQHIFGETHQ